MLESSGAQKSLGHIGKYFGDHAELKIKLWTSLLLGMIHIPVLKRFFKKSRKGRKWTKLRSFVVICPFLNWHTFV